MTPNARLSILHGIRMQVDALIAEEDAANLPAVEPDACPNCGAPEDKQVDASTMGSKRTMCIVCRVERAA